MSRPAPIGPLRGKFPGSPWAVTRRVTAFLRKAAMTVQEQNRSIEEFYRHALMLMHEKGPDYAPYNVVLYDLIVDACSLNLTPEVGLFLIMKKHISAVERFVLTRHLASESLMSRLTDLANFCALFEFYDTHREQVVRDVLTRLTATLECSCQGRDPLPCTRCRVERKLNQILSELSQVASSPWIQRPLDFSRGANPVR